MQSQDKGKSKCILADLYLFPAAVRLLNKTFFTCALCSYLWNSGVKGQTQ